LDEALQDWVVTGTDKPMPINIKNFPATQNVKDVDVLSKLVEQIEKQNDMIAKQQVTNEQLLATNEKLSSVIDAETGSIRNQLTGSKVGYSTENKNVIFPNATLGDQFLELDTKNVYFNDGTKWVKW
jgi:NAD dependent epimerase/dehydratase family enzyme